LSDEQARAPLPPPGDLGDAGRALWASIAARWQVEGRHVPVLLAACREHDRAEQAEATVRAQGAYVTDRYGGLKAHPAVGVARSSRLAVARLLRALELDDDPTPPDAGVGTFRRRGRPRKG
jgi:phage terminase small subunit